MSSLPTTLVALRDTTVYRDPEKTALVIKCISRGETVIPLHSAFQSLVSSFFLNTKLPRPTAQEYSSSPEDTNVLSELQNHASCAMRKQEETEERLKKEGGGGGEKGGSITASMGTAGKDPAQRRHRWDLQNQYQEVMRKWSLKKSSETSRRKEEARESRRKEEWIDIGVGFALAADFSRMPETAVGDSFPGNSDLHVHHFVQSGSNGGSNSSSLSSFSAAVVLDKSVFSLKLATLLLSKTNDNKIKLQDNEGDVELSLSSFLKEKSSVEKREKEDFGARKDGSSCKYSASPTASRTTTMTSPVEAAHHLRYLHPLPQSHRDQWQSDSDEARTCRMFLWTPDHEHKCEAEGKKGSFLVTGETARGSSCHPYCSSRNVEAPRMVTGSTTSNKNDDRMDACSNDSQSFFTSNTGSCIARAHSSTIRRSRSRSVNGRRGGNIKRKNKEEKEDEAISMYDLMSLLDPGDLNEFVTFPDPGQTDQNTTYGSRLHITSPATGDKCGDTNSASPQGMHNVTSKKSVESSYGDMTGDDLLHVDLEAQSVPKNMKISMEVWLLCQRARRRAQRALPPPVHLSSELSTETGIGMAPRQCSNALCSDVALPTTPKRTSSSSIGMYPSTASLMSRLGFSPSPHATSTEGGNHSVASSFMMKDGTPSSSFMRSPSQILSGILTSPSRRTSVILGRGATGVVRLGEWKIASSQSVEACAQNTESINEDGSSMSVSQRHSRRNAEVPRHCHRLCGGGVPVAVKHVSIPTSNSVRRRNLYHEIQLLRYLREIRLQELQSQGLFNVDTPPVREKEKAVSNKEKNKTQKDAEKKEEKEGRLLQAFVLHERQCAEGKGSAASSLVEGDWEAMYYLRSCQMVSNSKEGKCSLSCDKDDLLAHTPATRFTALPPGLSCLVPFYGVFRDGPSRVGIVLEYMDGGTLEDLVRKLWNRKKQHEDNSVVDDDVATAGDSSSRVQREERDRACELFGASAGTGAESLVSPSESTREMEEQRELQRRNSTLAIGRSKKHIGLRVREIVSILRCILRGLRWMHEVIGVIHRDIKPCNVLLSASRCAVCLADFGIAKGVHNAKTFCGTDAYIAPEVFASFAFSENLSLQSRENTTDNNNNNKDTPAENILHCSNSGDVHLNASSLGGRYGPKVDVFGAGMVLKYMMFGPNAHHQPSFCNDEEEGEGEDAVYFRLLHDLMLRMTEQDSKFRLSAAECLMHPVMELFAPYHSTIFLQGMLTRG